MKVRQKEILCWYCYYKAYGDRVENIKHINKIDDQSARTLVYNEIKALLPDVSDANLRQRTFRAKKIYTLLMGIGIEKVQAITCSTSAISSLTDNQIQDIINCFPKNSNVRIPTESSHSSNSKNMISEDKSLLETKISASSNPTYDRTYFRNKTLEQYPNLYKDGNSENVDYYGITDETLCPLCKLDHDDDEDIEGKYEIGSYYIKCEQCGIEIETKSNKTLTPEYLEWHNKFIGLPSVLTDKIHSKLYKRYKKETGLDSWINSETSESSQIEKGNYISQDCIIKISKFPEEKDPEAKCPICKEVHTRLGIWGDWSCLDKNDHYFLNCPFRIDQKKVIIAIQNSQESISNKPRETEPRLLTLPNKTRFYQYAIEHKIDPEKFSVITDAERNRWAM
ncbi:991_t:CDS:2, partial [Gigaspora rosea]